MPRGEGAAKARGAKDPTVLDDMHFKITAQASELIGLPNYSNITIGPVSIERLVEYKSDDPKKRRVEHRDALNELQGDLETVLAQRRKPVLDAVKESLGDRPQK